MKDFNTSNIRVVTLEGAPWFVAKDVCDVLGLVGYASQHTAKLTPDGVMVLRRESHVLNTRDAGNLFSSKAPTISLISESGLYKLAMRSDKPQAKPFQDWVTKEVLPSIRMSGAYVAGSIT